MIYTDLYRNFLFFSKKIWVKSFLWISPKFCWYPIWHYSNGALIIYPITTFFCSIKSSKKSYYTILILSFIHSSTLSLLIFTASAILSTGSPISARESAVSLAFFNSPSATPASIPASYSALRSFCSSSSLLYSKILRQSPPHDLLSEFFPKWFLKCI